MYVYRLFSASCLEYSHVYSHFVWFLPYWIANSANRHHITEELQTRLVSRFVKILLHAHELYVSHQDVVKGRLVAAENAIQQVDPVRDQDLFVDHNIRPFVAPSDFVFEPCSSHYDTVSIISINYVLSVAWLKFLIGRNECGSSAESLHTE